MRNLLLATALGLAAPIWLATAASAQQTVASIIPHADKYCVCDPGPVTPDCTAPQLGHWCLGSWLDVDTGQNSENDNNRDLFATTKEAFGGTTRAP
jgi:hypothetical protein